MGKKIEIKYIEKQPCSYTIKNLETKCQEILGHHVCWAVAHPQHGGFPTLYKTKKEAQEGRKGSQYVICKVAVIPLYGNICQVNEEEEAYEKASVREMTIYQAQDEILEGMRVSDRYDSSESVALGIAKELAKLGTIRIVGGGE